ncbi:MAG: hypothetical protein KDA78_13190 [Planctomycetaceae bacterium]|nr:hypothetical protein [Planctomycetaceae bacterium]
MNEADQPESTPVDHRLYVPHNEGWDAQVKTNSTKEYCYYRNPGEEHFHLLVMGELYLHRGNEKVCLNCAVRQDLLTTDRLHWQRWK